MSSSFASIDPYWLSTYMEGGHQIDEEERSLRFQNWMHKNISHFWSCPNSQRLSCSSIQRQLRSQPAPLDQIPWQGSMMRWHSWECNPPIRIEQYCHFGVRPPVLCCLIAYCSICIDCPMWLQLQVPCHLLHCLQKWPALTRLLSPQWSHPPDSGPRGGVLEKREQISKVWHSGD